MGAIHVSKLLGAMLARWKASGVCKEDVVSYAKDYLQWDAEGQEVWKLMAAYEEVADMHLVWMGSILSTLTQRKIHHPACRLESF
mmetsp:Transcript_16668/g.26654  ORF Transcript_16668/g.26654 Transcript_16668/m.26654 type:complete len:85 (+) Transcript_16668:153-407(+)